MIKDLKRQVQLANIAYSNGTPYLTEEEYNELWEQLFKLDPTCEDLYHTGSKIPAQSFEHVHLKPIYGVQKVFNEDDLKIFLTRFADEQLRVFPKYNGVGAVLYKTPDRVRLILQGNGFKGQDITYHLPYITYPEFSEPSLEVEIIIPNNRWNPKYAANQLSAVAGWMNRNTNEGIPKDTIFAVPHHKNPSIILLPPYNVEHVQEFLLSQYHHWCSMYPLDGLVLKLNSPEARLKVSHNGTYYLWSTAWKPPISTKTTEIVDIEWNVSRQGRIIPKIKYKPIDLCGTINQYVTGNNAKWVKDKQLEIGDMIVVGKAGEIIPKIVEVLTPKQFDKTYKGLPKTCPICEAQVEWYGVDLICTNPECIDQTVKKLAYFYSHKGMEIKFIGEAMFIELLQNKALYKTLTARPWVLLDPDEETLTKIIEVWGTVRAEKYLIEKEKINHKKNPANLIAAFGFKNLAYRKAMKNFKQLKRTGSFSGCQQEFILSVKSYLAAISEFDKFKLIDLPEEPDIYYAITGTLSCNRLDMEEYLMKYNWQAMSQVTKKTDLLILGDLPKDSTKLISARKFGTTIIDETEIHKYIRKEPET